MLPSEKLRKIISEKIGIDLEKHAWSEEFKKMVFEYKLDKDYEKDLDSLKEVFEYGLNIGHAGLTSRYLIRNIPDANLYYGKFPPMTGTKNSPDGNYAWIIYNGCLLDTTLMICLKVNDAYKLGYFKEVRVASESDKLLSEYELFSNEYKQYLEDKEAFAKDIIKVG